MLAIETSSRTGSVALGVDGVVTERTIAEPREQTARILALVDELLAAAGLGLPDLDALVFGRGPGSFTGLRIAAAVAQGLSLASGVPIVAVSSLAALALRGFRDASGDFGMPNRALCCVDARMGEVYWASFARAGSLVAAASEERIGRPSAVVAPEGRFVGLGDGFAACEKALGAVIAGAAGVVAELEPGAPELLALALPDVEAGRFVPPAAALPVYLREADAWKSR
jgi:tRNA threonylcarbamoyladenosine biosynthesis protein TsaB